MNRILKPGRNCSGIFNVTGGGLLVDGRNYYKAFYEVAQGARSHIFIAGWQFDSEVRLLRGKDAEGTEGYADMIHFLNALCERNTELEIYILAWDYSVVYALEREWFQKMLFQWKTDDRINFMFDSSHAVGASHHQKFVVIDDEIAFAGGLDICSDRWDERSHDPDNPRRINSDGSTYGPYHDVQAYVKGPVVENLREIFLERWRNAGGDPINVKAARAEKQMTVADVLPVKGSHVAVSRTSAKTVVPEADSIQEIRALYVDAIQAAERIIYLENQYFSSQAVYQALTDRMTARGLPALQVVMVFPKKPKAFVEELAMGVTQYRMFRSLQKVAEDRGHRLGIYFSARKNTDGTMVSTYIHAKLMIVDDRFITVGSANTTNRSMGLDTELNLSWEAVSPDESELVDSIRDIRVDLLAEHAGIEFRNRDDLKREEDLVDYLDREAHLETSRLWHIDPEELVDGKAWLKDIDMNSLPLDPDKPIVEENIYEVISHDKSGLFSRGIRLLNQWMKEKKEG